MANPFQSTEKQALDAYGNALRKPNISLKSLKSHQEALKHSGSLLEAQRNKDKKAVDKWMRKAEAGEIVRIM